MFLFESAIQNWRNKNLINKIRIFDTFARYPYLPFLNPKNVQNVLFSISGYQLNNCFPFSPVHRTVFRSITDMQEKLT